MPWDLNWKDFQDLKFSPNMDIGVIGGDELIEQRVLLRLIMMRGWIYDTTGELGSNLYTVLAQTTEAGMPSIPMLVLEALAPMDDEITVDDVVVRQPAEDSRAVEVIVQFHKTSDLAAPSGVQTIVFPLT